MSNWKTNLIGVGKLVLVFLYVGVKLYHGKAITDEDLVILGLGAGGGIGNWFSADANKVPPQ